MNKDILNSFTVCFYVNYINPKITLVCFLFTSEVWADNSG